MSRFGAAPGIHHLGPFRAARELHATLVHRHMNALSPISAFVTSSVSGTLALLSVIGLLFLGAAMLYVRSFALAVEDGPLSVQGRLGTSPLWGNARLIADMQRALQKDNVKQALDVGLLCFPMPAPTEIPDLALSLPAGQRKAAGLSVLQEMYENCLTCAVMESEADTQDELLAARHRSISLLIPGWVEFFGLFPEYIFPLATAASVRDGE